MRARSSVFALAAVLLATPAGAVVPTSIPGKFFGVTPTSRACATPDPTPFEREQVRAAVARSIQESGLQAVGGQIQVAFHVIYAGNEGNLPLSQIEAQITELNRAFSGSYGGANTGYTFVLASVDRTNSRKWFKMTPGTGAETQAKNALAIDPAHRLNLYSCKPGQSLLGWAVFPWSYPESNRMHGVVIHYASVPGGSLAPYDLGGTADHEVGHYLGLYHTFQGGCSAPGDEVADTPDEGTATSRCPIGKDTCAGAGLDPIHNYMDYSDDACYTQFTAGQDARMDVMVPRYRPSLLGAALAQAVAERSPEPVAPRAGWGVSLRGAQPNPFSTETTIHYSLPQATHVSLRVYDVAGKLVATLVDGDEPAGERVARFRAGSLPAGMYFTSLRIGGEQLRRSVVLVR